MNKSSVGVPGSVIDLSPAPGGGQAFSAHEYVVAVDIDGVLYELVDALRQWRHRRLGVPLAAMPDPGIYDLESAWGYRPGGLVADLVAGVRDGEVFWKGAAHRPGLAGVRALKAAGYRVVLVTARNLPGVEDLCLEATTSWLASPGVQVDYDELVLASDKTTVEWHFLVDDYEKNVRAGHAAGRHAVLVNRGWNARVAMRQSHWADIPALVAAARDGLCGLHCCS